MLKMVALATLVGSAAAFSPMTMVSCVCANVSLLCLARERKKFGLHAIILTLSVNDASTLHHKITPLHRNTCREEMPN